MADIHDVNDPPDGMGSLRFKTGSMSVAGKKQGGNTLLGRFLGRPSPSKENKASELRTRDDLALEELRSDELKGIVTPCPFIRPLEHKLQPRKEPGPLIHRSFPTPIPTSKSAISIARERGETNVILNSRYSVEGIERIRERHASTSEKAMDAQGSITAQLARLREYVAVNAALDATAVHHWRYYIECYSKGHFNLVAPPKPPPRSSTFKYLPAVYPDDEARRISVSSAFDIIWPQWAQEKAGALICAAMKKFDTRYASLSFFDDKHEMFKAENGYNKSHIARSISIAAHVLFSTDVLVVLDTKQDWRFQGNPLVDGKPKIRFFAGAPMLAPSGEVVGVFAIFGREPRASFTPFQRRELADFGALAMTDLNLQADWLSDPELRSTPILQRHSIINGDYRPVSFGSSAIDADSTDFESNLVPPALRYHKAKSPQDRTSRLFINRPGRDMFSNPSEYTPPSSDESDDGMFLDTRRGFANNQKQLLINSDTSDIPIPRELIAPESQHFRQSCPRPFSASDITSLNLHPPNTPVQSLVDGTEPSQPNLDLTVENFLSLSDNDCAEQPQTTSQSAPAVPSSPLINFSSPNVPDGASVLTGSKSLVSILSPSSRLTMSSISTTISDQSRASSDPMAEAAFACAFFAQSLAYDLIYAVELKPSRPGSTDKDLFSSEGLKKRILVAYGLDQPLELSSEVHIRVLRSRGYESWENRRTPYEEGEYQSGCLIPIHTEGGPRKLRSSGIVFGAFKKPKLIEVGAVEPTELDFEKLLDAAMALKDILLKPAARKHPKRSNTEPITPNPYPANEAVEVWKGSLDSGVQLQ